MGFMDGSHLNEITAFLVERHASPEAKAAMAAERKEWKARSGS